MYHHVYMCVFSSLQPGSEKNSTVYKGFVCFNIKISLNWNGQIPAWQCFCVQHEFHGSDTAWQGKVAYAEPWPHIHWTPLGWTAMPTEAGQPRQHQVPNVSNALHHATPTLENLLQHLPWRIGVHILLVICQSYPGLFQAQEHSCSTPSPEHWPMGTFSRSGRISQTVSRDRQRTVCVINVRMIRSVCERTFNSINSLLLAKADAKINIHIIIIAIHTLGL